MVTIPGALSSETDANCAGFEAKPGHDGRFRAPRLESTAMPDLASLLIRRSLGAAAPADSHCSECRRTPLAGERLHELESGPLLCELCFGALPEERRRAVRSERVRASERRLVVAPRAV